jgi:hypothetical protein
LFWDLNSNFKTREFGLLAIEMEGEAASGYGDIVIIISSGGNCFLGAVGREEAHANVHG